MAAHIDTTRAPRGQMAVESLVDQLTRTDDRVEHHYLEVKRDLDTSTALGRAKLAKFILGAANREPAVAQRHFEGCAIMVIGIDQGARPGIQPVEILALQQAVARYLPEPGPMWDVMRARADTAGREVLLVVVDAPKQGDPFSACRKDFHPDDQRERKHALRDGAIYVRGNGETREAKSTELDRLVARMTDVPVQAPEISIEPVGSVLRYTAPDAMLEAWLEEKAQGLLGALPATDESAIPTKARFPFDATAVSPLLRNMQLDEDRTEGEYRREIETWRARCREAWPSILDKFAAGRWQQIVFRVSNKSQEVSLEGLHLELHVEGDVIAIPRKHVSHRDDPRKALPAAPRKWGPRPPFDLGQRISVVPGVMPMRQQQLPRDVTARFENGGSVKIPVKIAELRLLSSVTTEDALDVALITRDPELIQAHVTWIMTARGPYGQFQGDCSIPVEDRTFGEVQLGIHR